MDSDELFSTFETDFKRRKFSAGLLIALIDFYRALGVPGSGFTSLEDVLTRFPRQTMTKGKGKANTLIVSTKNGEMLSLRPFYDAVENLFRATHKRFDYPSCAPHATQAWEQYPSWLNSLATYDEPTLLSLRDRVIEHVLFNLKDQSFDPASLQIEPPLFRIFLESFDMAAKAGEKSGSTLQGAAFGFIRADNPHLQIEVDRVRTGSKRLQRVGDIDGWDGARLAITAEVKQLIIRDQDVPGLEAFGNAAGRRGALGLIISLGFEGDARERIEDLGLKALDRDEMLRIVELWDPRKQQTATSSLIYYARHVEKNAALTERIENFLEVAASDSAS